MSTLVVCIPTYKRVHLLVELIQDLARQSVQPECLIIVDGDPASGEVLFAVKGVRLPIWWQVLYVPSNHGNLPYQRYLGWRVAENNHILIFLDDDLRIEQRDALARLMEPFSWSQPHVVGVTCAIRFTSPGEVVGKTMQCDQQTGRRSGSIPSWLKSRVEPGGLTPSGHRKMPVSTGEDYTRVHWLTGGVMALRSDAFNTHFSDGLFAMYERRVGKAEDTYISRQFGRYGELLFASCVEVNHPSADAPQAYPSQAHALGYATAYSRRFLNDHYRVTEPPRLSDRLALLKSYAGNTLLSWWHALTSFKAYRFAYAWGYMLGALRGLVQRPTAEKLTPDIDWWADAEAALANTQVIQPGSRADCE